MKLFVHHWLVMLSLSILAGNLFALDTTTEIPDSLGKWYKPENKRQVWLHTMFAMRRELQAVEEYSAQGDVASLKKWSDKLISHYRRLPEMVPEWLDEVDLEAVTDLETAVAKGDLSIITSTTRNLSRSCQGCHSDFRVLARLRFRTANFDNLEILQQGKPVSLQSFKKEMIKTVNRIKISAVDNHWDKADSALKTLEFNLRDYAVSCASCHKDEQPRERILGSESWTGLDKLQQSISSKDLKQTGRYLGAIAVNICARCHGVHRTLSEISGDM